MSKLAAKYIILGMGPTGIGAALRLLELGIKDFLIIDKQSDAGGLSSSVVDENGFTWDFGGHVQFSHYQKFDEAMDLALGKDGYFHHQRESWVYLKDRFVPYPFQYNLHRLPQEDQNKALAGLEDIQGLPVDKTNFQTFLESSFGSGICDVFLSPYNFKVWAHPPSLMSCQWTAERVAPVSLDKVKNNLKEQQDQVSWGPNHTFKFPKEGGTGAIWKSLAKNIPTAHLRMGQTVTSIDVAQKSLLLENGERYTYEKLISTIPINLLAQYMKDTELSAQTDGLLFSATHIIGIGLEGQPPKDLKTKCWMYFPEDNCPFYRVTVFSNYSPNNTPRPGRTWSLMAEVSESEHKPVDSKRILENVIEGMYNTRLISADDLIISQFHKRLEQGYPIPGLQRDHIIEQALPYLEKFDIFSRGRFGAWKYEVSNQDHSFMQGVEVVERLVHGNEERTLNFPNEVNKQHNPFPYTEWKSPP